MATSPGITSSSDDISSEVGDVMDDQSQSTTKRTTNISFLCNPNDEELGLRQESVSELVGDNLGSVQKRSWAKDSSCERVHFT